LELFHITILEIIRNRFSPQATTHKAQASDQPSWPNPNLPKSSVPSHLPVPVPPRPRLSDSLTRSGERPSCAASCLLAVSPGPSPASQSQARAVAVSCHRLRCACTRRPVATAPMPAMRLLQPHPMPGSAPCQLSPSPRYQPPASNEGRRWRTSW
jgi:hypothetical protein